MSEVLHIPAGSGETVWVGDDVYTFKATRKNTDGRLSFVDASVPPGAGPPPHAHTDADEAFYVLDGELDMLAGDDVFKAGSGDFVFVPRGTVHRFHNGGLHTVRMVFFHIPGGFDEYLAAIGKPARPGTRPEPPSPGDMEDGARLAEDFGLVMPQPPR